MASTTSDINERRLVALDRALIFSIWLILAAALCWFEVVWRDEVRALSIALQGNSFVDMFRHLHGEGHAALWYILLRAGYLVTGAPLVLKALAFAIAATAAYFLVYRLHLPRSVQLLALFGNFSIYEYAAMSRNYGISMLLVFMIAAAYERWKHNSLVLGLLLACLANTNVHSVVLVCGLLAYWFLDLALAKPRPALSEYRYFAANAAIAVFGIVLCAVTVYPPFNDAAQINRGSDGLAMLVLRAVIFPGLNFIEFYPTIVISQLAEHRALFVVFVPLMSVLIYGSVVSLAARPAAMVAAFLTLVGLSLLFTVVYPGSYRHEALWLVFMIAMIALSADIQRTPIDASTPSKTRRAVIKFGRLCFLILLALQVVSGIEKAKQVLVTDTPLSRSQDFSNLVLSRPDLRDAIIIADPDYLVEALPYYIPNRTYLLREGRFGDVVKFTKNAKLELSLADILQAARKLHDDQQVPVIILLSQRLDLIAAPVAMSEGYNWQLTITAAEITEFRDATELIRRFGAVAGSDETFDAYLLK
ncbi:hypothetical protein [Rhizobium sp. NPDC090279]|uniref:hypothetical protein n=1 Tax=Rhizobium sp. NPDC090279 TaxID=3364499 RepID=UPI00383B8793